MSRRVLVVEDEVSICGALVDRLREDGHEVFEAGSAAEAAARAVAGVDLILLDDTLPDDDDRSFLARASEIDPDVPVIALVTHRQHEIAADVIKAGALDYVKKPLDFNDVSVRVGRGLEIARIRRELRTERDTRARPYGLDAIVGESDAMQRVITLTRRIAASPGSTVLLTGERGTGKDLIAGVMHYASRRAARPFLSLTCAMRPETQLEFELFGYERGAFPDADRQRRGLFEQAMDGTVLLSDVDELTPALQAKLLRLLEERAIRRVGASADVQVDVRVVAATRANLEDHVQQGTFRDDLYYRLQVLRVDLPPLRERGGDVARLARHFVERYGRELRRPARALSAAAEASLAAYGWPGNVRELGNLLERAVMVSDEETLEPIDFETLHAPHVTLEHGHSVFSLPAEGVHLEEVERSLVVQALDRAGGNQTRAAALLGLHRDQIRYRIEKFGLIKKS